MAETYSRVLRALMDQPWAIRQSMLDTMCAVVHARASGVTLTKDEIQAQMATTAAARPTQQIIGTVGVIPVVGILAQKMNMFLDISGGTSYQQLMKQFREFRDDPQVKAIVFEHDSPGGEVFGLIEAAEEIFAARDTKRLIAVVNPLSASASYFLASACHEIVITPSGEVGCIGTILCHTDYSKQNDILGINPTYIVSSQYKAEGNEDQPLTDDALAYLQAQVNAYGDQFEKFVAKGRSVPIAKVKRDFGQGRILLAKDAVTVGMVDRIASFDETIGKLVGRKSVGVSGAQALVGGGGDACSACNGTGLKPERFMSDPQGQEMCTDCGGTGKAPEAAVGAKTPKADEGVPPDESGACPEGYEFNDDDGLCHPIEPLEPAAVTDQAAADRDSFEIVRTQGL